MARIAARRGWSSFGGSAKRIRSGVRDNDYSKFEAVWNRKRVFHVRSPGYRHGKSHLDADDDGGLRSDERCRSRTRFFVQLISSAPAVMLQALARAP